MNKYELKYSLLSIVSLALATYVSINLNYTLGFILTLLGIFCAIKSTNPKKPIKWVTTVVLCVIVLVAGFYFTQLYLPR